MTKQNVLCVVLVLNLAATPVAQVLPDPVAEENPRLLHSLLAAVMVLEGADIASSMYCLGADECAERNRVMFGLQDHPVLFGSVKMALATASVLVVLKTHKTHPKVALVVSAMLATLYAGVVVHNWHALRAAERRR